MRTRLSHLAPLLAGAGAAAAIAGAPTAVADDSNPTCTDLGGTTECSTPGNVQINDSPPVVDNGMYPIPWWDDVYGGPTVDIGGGGNHGGGHR